MRSEIYLQKLGVKKIKHILLSQMNIDVLGLKSGLKVLQAIRSFAHVKMHIHRSTISRKNACF